MSISTGCHSPFVTEAVVLGQTAYGEADRVMTLYTRSHGKVSAIAQAARRSRGRFGASLALFVVGEATLREPPRRDLLVLERFDVRRDLSGLAVDVVRFAHASYATELVRELTVPHKAEPELLDLLVELYDVVARTEPSADTLRAFELRLLFELGVSPELTRCVECGEADEMALARAGTVASPHKGGLLCSSCAKRVFAADTRPLPPAARERLMGLMALGSLELAAALPRAPAPLAATVRDILHAILAGHLARPLRSLAFINQLRSA